MDMKLEGTTGTKEVRLVDLERSLMQARSLVCAKYLVRGLLRCVRQTYGALEERRIIAEHQLFEYQAD